MQLPVQNQIPCAGSFGCQRIHVILNKHDDKLDRLEEICFMEKLITRKEAAEILGISIATLDAARNNGLKRRPAFGFINGQKSGHAENQAMLLATVSTRLKL